MAFLVRKGKKKKTNKKKKANQIGIRICIITIN